MTASATRGLYDDTTSREVTASDKKLSRTALTGMVVGSMVGAGIFSLPATFGAATGPFGALVAWTIAGLGMLTLALVFQALAVQKPDLDAGIFAYAREGFGNYAGFIAAFGFWASSCLGNVTYWVLIKSTLGKVWPVFGEGDTVQAVLASSVLLWFFHALILRGIKEAAAINTIVTVAKIVPIVLFIVILIGAFRGGLFAQNFWGGQTVSFSGVVSQIRSTMLVTVFVFIGIEGASVYSRYAKERKDVGWATVVGFSGVLCLLVLVTVLPYAVMTRGELGELRQPSMAGVLAHVVGTWGAVFVSVGLMISVLGAYLAWTLLAAEALHASAKAGLIPQFFTRENRREVPSTALWVTGRLRL
jgi:arginine:ornithine antiporter/lysine permease